MSAKPTKIGCGAERADAYSVAVAVLQGSVSRLTAAGVGPDEQCDALAYTLVSLLAEHYPYEHSTVLLETLQATLGDCYEMGPAPAREGGSSVVSH